MKIFVFLFCGFASLCLLYTASVLWCTSFLFIYIHISLLIKKDSCENLERYIFFCVLLVDYLMYSLYFVRTFYCSFFAPFFHSILSGY